MKRMPFNRQSGFSLLELMITLGILGILTTIAYPSMRDFMRRNRVVAESNSIQADLQLARGQAAATRGYVSICPQAVGGGTTCDAAAKNYDQGWLVYTSTSPNAVYDGTATKLQHISPAQTNVSMRASSGGVLTYNARGELLISATPNASATFITCAMANEGDSVGTSTTAVPGMQLDVANSGRVASNKLAAGASCTP
jgi:prepilin-type N-terminal cleavage/methylation domain